MASRHLPALAAPLALWALLLPASALAQRPNTVPPETCTAKTPPPASMEAWSSPSPLPAAPWMDVFAAGGSTPARTGRFGRGPACSGVGKMVEFALQPGDYLLQISASLAPDAELMVVKTGS